jgi:hypothetical protein
MARWYIDRPKENANEGELAAYQALRTLGDDWTIRWGYDYLAGNTPCEGDFLILGPDGRLVVLEVKKRLRVYTRSGSADGTAKEDRAEDQVQSQKSGVLSALREKEATAPSHFELPFIVPALFSATGSSFQKRTHGQPFSTISGKDYLEKLPALWEEITAGGRSVHHPDRVRNLFHAVYGDASPEAESRFLNETQKLLIEQAVADFSLVEALGDNRQLLVRGGPGSGKTWMAQYHARRLANAGKKVLFLCYNKALGTSLRHDLLAPKGKPRHGGLPMGSIHVHTWESLADLLSTTGAAASLPPKPAAEASREAHLEYYERRLPEAMQEAVTAGTFEPLFDALVVDEAQDHNTDWWGIYLELLREKGGAPVGVYYDPEQRPDWRDGDFDLGAISRGLSQHAHLRLLETRRYTRPIFDYLHTLQSEETDGLIRGLFSRHLLAGPDVVEESHPSYESAKNAAAAWLKKLFTEKLADPSDTLLLTPHDPFLPHQDQDALFRNCEGFAGCSLVPADAPHGREKGNLRTTSFNKAKGLDARAVVLLDTPPWSALTPKNRESFWIAASRARQLLGVFTGPSDPNK